MNPLVRRRYHRPSAEIAPNGLRNPEARIYWQPPPLQLLIQPGRVHLWRVMLNTGEDVLLSLQALLGEDERVRAERFRFPCDRRRYIVAHSALRLILSRYCGRPPQAIRFQYNPHGKPLLAPDLQNDGGPLHFNLSHSDELALIGLALGGQIGVDIERVRPELADERLAERFFSPREVAKLRSLPAGEQPEAFFRYWTCKEALVKACGSGLSLPLDRFDISVAPDTPAAPLSVAGAPVEAKHWSLRTLTPAPGYIAAIAVEGHSWHLTTWDWTPQTAT
ncbi:MAG: 4'-phosphopantetheinyl transferase family protein [Anaerolineae bacterium]